MCKLCNNSTRMPHIPKYKPSAIRIIAKQYTGEYPCVVCVTRYGASGLTEDQWIMRRLFTSYITVRKDYQKYHKNLTRQTNSSKHKINYSYTAVTIEPYIRQMTYENKSNNVLTIKYRADVILNGKREVFTTPNLIEAQKFKQNLLNKRKENARI